MSSVVAGVDEWSATGGGGDGDEDSAEKPPGGLVRSPGFDASHGGSFSGEDGGAGGGGALLKGDLATRPKSGDGPWRPAHYVLEKGRLLVFEDRHHVRPKQVSCVLRVCACILYFGGLGGHVGSAFF